MTVEAINGSVNSVNDLYGKKVGTIQGSTAAGFLDRREMGVLNIGDTGQIRVDGTAHRLDKGEMLYIGMGAGAVEFTGAGRY